MAQTSRLQKRSCECACGISIKAGLWRLEVDGVKWHFNAPADPEAGGVWGRQVRTVKETLRNTGILREQRPSAQVLRTLCDVEKILNSTPLFHVPVDAANEEVLTPFHFLIGQASMLQEHFMMKIYVCANAGGIANVKQITSGKDG